MSRWIWITVACALLAVVVAVRRVVRSMPDVAVKNSRPLIPEAHPPCPWRDAEQDLKDWFPGATGYEAKDMVLSGKRIELQQRLGRPLLPDENALHTYLVRGDHRVLGSVLTRRCKTENGSIEIALALDDSNRVAHFKIQRIREPEEIVQALNALSLSEGLRGKSIGENLDSVFAKASNTVAAATAQAVKDGVRSLLIMHEASHSSQAHH